MSEMVFNTHVFRAYLGMAGAIKLRSLIVYAMVAEVLTLAVGFVLPWLQGRAFPDPRFPRVIVFHHGLPSCIVDFQGNFFESLAESAVFWICIMLIVAGLVRLIRNNDRRVDEEISRLNSQGL